MENQEQMNQINDLVRQIVSLQHELNGLNGNPSFFEQENERIEHYLSEFTNREGVMITVASLLSLLPFFNDTVTTRYFLIWVFPFLIISIFTYVLSSKRINIVSSLNTNLIPNMQEQNEIIKKNYFESLRFHRITDAVLVSFFISFVVNYYLSIFQISCNLITSFLVSFISVLLGYMRFRNAAYSGEVKQEGVLMVGGVPPLKKSE